MANEEIRRLCWATLILVSDYIAQCETFGEEYPNFYVTEPTNVSSDLFPCYDISQFRLVSPSFSRRNPRMSVVCVSFVGLFVSEGVCLGPVLSQYAALEFLSSASKYEGGRRIV